MDFSLNEEQTQIKDLANQILRENCHDEFLAQHFKSGELYSQSLWQLLTESGLLGTAVPEEHGGSGFGLSEICQILEEQGRHVAPVPLLSSLVLGGMTLARFGTPGQQTRYLPQLAAGAILTGAIAEESMVASMRPACQATQHSDLWALNGERLCVPYAAQSIVILVAAETSDGPAVFLVEPQANGLSSEYVDSTNHEPLYHLRFDQVAAEYLGGSEVLSFMVQHATVASCAITVGITEEALRRTAEYTQERKQFGVSIANFQNTTMKCADAYIDIECLRSAYFEALWRLSSGQPARAEVLAAKWWASTGSHRVAHITQHLHGGIGADIEYPLHRYYLWFKQMDILTGGGTWQLAQLGQLMADCDRVNLLPEAAA
jgi:alkylation response protein AidB-like acyl-CoA dehydrogenase